jgi:SpoVK/Ycf46/Vps4 family AAA+-type ATPase/DNA-binding response OmpR family regulator
MGLDDANNIEKNSRYKILIVDDEHDAAYAFKSALEQNNQLSVDAFTDPLVALGSFSTELYDLLLLNVKMPKMDGFELCEKIREADKKVKICFITSQVNCEVTLNTYYRNLNVSRVIQKPIENQELVRIVTSELENNNDNNKDSDFEIQEMQKENIYDRMLFTDTEYNQVMSYNNKINNSHFKYICYKGEPRNKEQTSFHGIGGLEEQLKQINEIIQFFLIQSESCSIEKTSRRVVVEEEQVGVGLANIAASRGLLLYGPTGTGKSLLERAVKDITNKINVSFYEVSALEIISQRNFGESEEKLKNLFQQAKATSPSIIFIDGIENIAAKKETVNINYLSYRITCQLIDLMDDLASSNSESMVLVIGATNKINLIEPTLRRSGRFDKEIEFKVPDRNGRLEILRIHTKKVLLDADVDLGRLADITDGFVGSDLYAMCKEALERASKRALVTNNSCSINYVKHTVLSMQDFMDAFRGIKPVVTREIFIGIPRITWDDVGGLDLIKRELQQALVYQFKYPKSFRAAGITPCKGILLHGPPGTGKTLLAGAIANECNSAFISIKGPELIGKWIGESERNVRDIFTKAKEYVRRCIIFFDEFDAIGAKVFDPDTGDSPTMRRVIDQLLSEMDGLEEISGNIVVLAATNNLNIIEPALLRPGRFDKLLYITPPDRTSRLHILKIHTKRKKLADDLDLKSFAERLDGFVGADLELLVNEAAMFALEEHLLEYDENAIQADDNAEKLKIHLRHFEQAKEKIVLRKGARNKSGMYI